MKIRPENSKTLFWGNTVNQLMLPSPVPEHSNSLAVLAQRKLWLAGEGDALVTASPINSSFRQYVEQTISVNQAEVTVAAAGTSLTTPLSDALKKKELKDFVLNYLQKTKAKINCYALDYDLWEMGKEFGIDFEGYSEYPSKSLIDKIYELNSKTGFRNLAAKLGLNIPPGCPCRGNDEIIEATCRLMKSHNQVIIRLDRSSNGYGNLIIRNGSIAEIKNSIASHLELFSPQGEKYVVEVFLALKMSPSVEFSIEDEGLKPLYVCDQNFKNNLFSGIITPPVEISETIEQKLRQAGVAFGNHLKSLGYRGIFDLDGGITSDGEIVFTEVNVRRTAGTTLYELVSKLVGKTTLASVVWIYDSGLIKRKISFEKIVSILRSSGQMYSPVTKQGVILPAYTVPVDNRLRYLIIAPDWEAAKKMEMRFNRLFHLE
ncbi:MAG: hypothetical protein H0U45_01650 [Tatlockia sp.]|jgi:hypothetical protein|nr:hypothetical protein [Tatlockia sp.]